MREEGRSLIELVIILPMLMFLLWFAYDGVLVYRDEYLLHYALFHGLRVASAEESPSSVKLNLRLNSLLILGEKGTGTWLPFSARLSTKDNRLSSSVSLIRDNLSLFWPPASSELSVQREAKK